MREGKLIIIPALGHQNKGNSSFTGSSLFVLMSQCGNNNELALQHGGFCTTWSLVAKGLFITIANPLSPNKKQVQKEQKMTKYHFTICLPLDKATWTFCNRPSSSSNTSADHKPQLIWTHSSKPQQRRRPAPEDSASPATLHRRHFLASA